MGWVLLLGGGGHAKVVADAVRSRGWHIVGYLDDDPAKQVNERVIGGPWLGAIENASDITRDSDRSLLIHAAVGSAANRRRWIDRITCARLDPIVHPSATVSHSAVLEEACFIGPGAVVNAEARIGRGSIVNSGAVIEHDAHLGRWCHAAPRSVLAGCAVVGDDVLIGCGAVVLPGVTVGARSTIAAGAVVHEPVPAGATARGVPARLAEAAT